METKDQLALSQTNEADSSALSGSETRAMLTPFAFKVNESLFGLPLAKPWPRGGAILIDLLAIAILSAAPGELLAIVIAITAFKLGSAKRAQQLGKTKGKKRRAVVRFIGAFILFVVLVDSLPKLFSEDNSNTVEPNTTAEELSLEDTAMLAAAVIKLAPQIEEQNCQTTQCWQKLIEPAATELVDTNVPTKVVRNGIKDLLEDSGLSEADEKLLLKQLVDDFKVQRKSIGKEEPAVKETAKNENKPEQQSAFDEIYFYTKGIIKDLGLGFGWAAFYFTVLTALWQGQTLGKKLFHIKVVQLDGTPLKLWDSFGRYGGYAAGLATGLLGFLQIFWDPNRQAIHDKISATIVINTKLKKYDYFKGNNNENT